VRPTSLHSLKPVLHETITRPFVQPALTCVYKAQHQNYSRRRDMRLQSISTKITAGTMTCAHTQPASKYYNHVSHICEALLVQRLNKTDHCSGLLLRHTHTIEVHKCSGPLPRQARAAWLSRAHQGEAHPQPNLHEKIDTHTRTNIWACSPCKHIRPLFAQWT